MTSFHILMFAVNCILSHAVVKASTQCPVNCTCVSRESKCSNIKSVLSGPFPSHVVNVTISNSNLTKLEPYIFGPHIENILIESTNITEITSYTFTNLRSLSSLRFKGVFIGRIKHRSLHNITSHADIEFTDSKIDRLEDGAVSDMPGLKRISISFTAVDDIDSQAFFNIRVRDFIVMDTDITNVNTSSFCSISNVDNFQLSMVNIVSVKAGAFKNINNIQRVNINNCRFKDLHCNALMKLREATPGNHDSFVFSNSHLVCACLIVPMLDYVRNNENAISDSVMCVGNRAAQKRLKDFKAPQSCTEEDKTCESHETLTSTFKTNTPVNTMPLISDENCSPVCINLARITLLFSIIFHICNH